LSFAQDGNRQNTKRDEKTTLKKEKLRRVRDIQLLYIKRDRSSERVPRNCIALEADCKAKSRFALKRLGFGKNSHMHIFQWAKGAEIPCPF
jgi:hypothetical protein